MKVLLTSIGSRGDVQPMLALALELKALGQRPVICVAPNFQSWVESFGIDFVPIGPDLEKWMAAPRPKKKFTQAQLQEFARLAVVDQFRVTGEAAQGCDLIVVGGVLQTAGSSIAESLKIPYVYASYCPATLPSPDHPPSKITSAYPQSLPGLANRLLWMEDRWMFNRRFRDPLNEHRAGLGLAPVSSVSRYITTDQPWLAADPVLGPAGSPMNMHITQTGAWFLADTAPLTESLETFLAEGEPPIYFGFGSMQASDKTGDMLLEAARTLGRRAIISQGWAGLKVSDAGADCISVGSVNHEKLFSRVAAIVHHGGGGTTTAAARGGKPQVVIPHNYDQYYWAHRVQKLGIGVSDGNAAKMTADSLVAALRKCLKPETVARASELTDRMELHGARKAAERLIQTFA